MPVIFKSELAEDVENLVTDVQELLCLQPKKSETEYRRNHDRSRSSPCSGHGHSQHFNDNVTVTPEPASTIFSQCDSRLEHPCTYLKEHSQAYSFGHGQLDLSNNTSYKKRSSALSSHCKYEPYERQRKNCSWRKSRMLANQHDDDSNSSVSSRSSSIDELEDPHLLLQKLLAEQSLIHEAVRRLNLEQLCSKSPSCKSS